MQNYIISSFSKQYSEQMKGMDRWQREQFFFEKNMELIMKSFPTVSYKGKGSK